MTTTATLIRDRIVTVIRALTPTYDTGVKYIPFNNELDADFRKWANENAPAADRRFQVRDTGDDETPEVTNHDVEEEFVSFDVLVAYPQTNRWGSENALDRDDVMRQDQDQIKQAIGMDGAANFASPYPDACFRPESSNIVRERDGACDFIVMRCVYSFYRSHA
jgi:hypothetical protein